MVRRDEHVVKVCGKALMAEGVTFLDPVFGWLTVTRVHWYPSDIEDSGYASDLYCRIATRKEIVKSHKREMRLIQFSRAGLEYLGAKDPTERSNTGAACQ
jgi:hypothetical protein